MAQPNVLFLVVDSLRADATYGGHVPTPNFDSFRARGTTFRQCVCTTTTTTPSFSSMLTGSYPPRHGVRGLQGYRLSPSLTTMAEAFSAAGYQTYAEATGPLIPETGVLRGFDEARHRQAYRVPFFGWRDEVVERMRAYVEPWFMMLHIWEVHRPFRSPPDFTKRFDRSGYEAALTATDEWLRPVYEAAGDDTLFVITGDHGEEYPDTPLEQKLNRVARVARRKLKPSRWWPWLDKKFSAMAVGHGFALYEHLVRVPLIMAGPGIPTGEVHDQVRHVDLLPTLAEVCDLEAPKNIDGRSVRTLMDGGSLPEEPAYMEAVGVKLEGKRILGARTPEWKLLKPGGGRASLHKIEGDPPDEKKNLYNRYPEVATHLESFIQRVQEAAVDESSGMTADEEAIVEQQLKDLGYL